MEFKPIRLQMGSLGLTVSPMEDCVTLQWDSPVEVLSSALYNGGRQTISSLLNMQVGHNTSEHYGGFDPPGHQLEAKAASLGLKTPMAGMMTSASMKSFRWHLREEGELYAFCFMTVGTTNARAAGDPADCVELEAHQAGSGTINIALGTNACLSEAALAEALMLAAEARAWTLCDFQVKSPVTGRIASGTGTDSILVFSGNGPEVHFCGKHTLLGEMLADAVIQPLSSAMRVIEQLQAGLVRVEEL